MQPQATAVRLLLALATIPFLLAASSAPSAHKPVTHTAAYKTRHAHESMFGGAYGSLFGGWKCTPSREWAIKAYWRSVNAMPKKPYRHYDIVAEPWSSPDTNSERGIR
jgi:hypothetical protein